MLTMEGMLARARLPGGPTEHEHCLLSMCPQMQNSHSTTVCQPCAWPLLACHRPWLSSEWGAECPGAWEQ